MLPTNAELKAICRAQSPRADIRDFLKTLSYIRAHDIDRHGAIAVYRVHERAHVDNIEPIPCNDDPRSAYYRGLSEGARFLYIVECFGMVEAIAWLPHFPNVRALFRELSDLSPAEMARFLD